MSYLLQWKRFFYLKRIYYIPFLGFDNNKMADQRQVSAIIYQLEDQLTELENKEYELLEKEETESIRLKLKKLDKKMSKVLDDIDYYTKLLKILENAEIDNSYSYDGWDEVFTGGDY